MASVLLLSGACDASRGRRIRSRGTTPDEPASTFAKTHRPRVSSPNFPGRHLPGHPPGHPPRIPGAIAGGSRRGEGEIHPRETSAVSRAYRGASCTRPRRGPRERTLSRSFRRGFGSVDGYVGIGGVAVDAEAEADRDKSASSDSAGQAEDAKRGSSVVAVRHAVCVQPTLGGLRDERLVKIGARKWREAGEMGRFAVARVESDGRPSREPLGRLRTRRGPTGTAWRSDSRFVTRMGARTVLLNFGRATLRFRIALASSRVVLPRPKEPAAVSVPRTRSVREQLYTRQWVKSGFTSDAEASSPLARASYAGSPERDRWSRASRRRRRGRARGPVCGFGREEVPTRV